MRDTKERYDIVVFGAGLFGSYAALHFCRRGMRVLLVERENRAWSKASFVNQARVHSGYHYPRSMKTARMAHDHRERFIRDNEFAINTQYNCYYGIDRYGSLTSAEQFERFCRKLDIPLRQTMRSDLFDLGRLEALFETQEFSFDPLLIRGKFLREIEESEVELLTGWTPVAADRAGDEWIIELRDTEGNERQIRAGGALNATYANINKVNRIFDEEEIPVTHEISEIVLLHSRKMAGTGLTVMDGPYCSIMPYGLSGLLSLTSVLYTHKAYCAGHDPEFNCQRKRADCTPQTVRDCTSCPVRPESNKVKMLSQIRHYLASGTDLYVHGSLLTVKTKLKSAFMDDGRPTDIRVYRKKPFFGCVFSGKINSIYEIERLDSHV